jgi:hypothetical protein
MIAVQKSPLGKPEKHGPHGCAEVSKVYNEGFWLQQVGEGRLGAREPWAARSRNGRIQQVEQTGTPGQRSFWSDDGQTGSYERGAAHLTRLTSSDSKARKVKSGRLHPIPA